MKARLPTFFIVGAAKAGTTSLYAYLKHHPQVVFFDMKEPHFYAGLHPSPSQRHRIPGVQDRRDYLALFRKASSSVAIGDASPSYRWSAVAPFRIRDDIPDAKIIVLLRDPVERAFSHYLMDHREGVTDLGFYDALVTDMNRPDKGWGISQLYVEIGMYASPLERYLDVFPR